MNPDLSRRASLIMHTPMMYKLGFDERDAFIRAIEQAPDFNALDQKWQQLILAGETHVSKGSTLSIQDDGSLDAPAQK